MPSAFSLFSMIGFRVTRLKIIFVRVEDVFSHRHSYNCKRCVSILQPWLKKALKNRLLIFDKLIFYCLDESWRASGILRFYTHANPFSAQLSMDYIYHIRIYCRFDLRKGRKICLELSKCFVKLVKIKYLNACIFQYLNFFLFLCPPKKRVS